jgi:hypothetical protein
MTKSLLTIALTLTVLVGAGMNALAQDSDRVVVKVPFEFVVGTKTLPAGTYTVGRFSPGVSSGLLIKSYDNGAFVLPIVADSMNDGSPKFSFDQVGGKYFLSKVETPNHSYNVGTSPEMIKLGQVKDNGNPSSAGGN